MLYIVISAFLLIIAIAAGTYGFYVTSPNGNRYGIPGFISGYILVTMLWLVMTAIASVHIIDARNVGVIRTFGSITGQVGEGFQVTWPWQTVEEWYIRIQAIEPDTTCVNGSPKCMDAASIDIQDVYVQGVLNIEVSVVDVQELSRNVGPDYINTIVRNRLYQVVKQSTAQYKADEIISSREDIRGIVRETMIRELEPFSITVTDFLITNIDFTDGFREVIDAKQRATQEALTAQNTVLIREAEARQRIAAAEGEARANEIINASLTGSVLQLRLAELLADNIQIALVPSGEGIILDPTNILAPRP